MQWTNKKQLDTRFIKPIKKVTDDKYYEMLECLPPVAMVKNAFLVGEPVAHVKGRPVYDLYFRIKDAFYFGGYTTTSTFKAFCIPSSYKLN